MSDQEPVATTPADPALQRLRRLTVVGLGLSFVAAAAIGVVGATGRGGLMTFLLCAALTAGVTGLVGVVEGLRDEARQEPVSRGRLVWSISAFGLATILLAMVVGVAG